MAANIERDQAHHHGQHVKQGQLYAKAPGGDQDSGDLTTHSQPAQVNQMQHVFVTGFIQYVCFIKRAGALPNGNNVGIYGH